ncbi:MAG: GtrA family protein [Mesorhizobium sp.]
MIDAATARKFGGFLGAGAIGFSVDAVVFFTLVLGLGAHFSVGRVVASAIAMTATWLINRSFAFRTGRLNSKANEALRYYAASICGALANLAVVAMFFTRFPVFNHIPVYIAGTAAGLVVNYVLYDKFVFRGNGGKRAA